MPGVGGAIAAAWKILLHPQLPSVQRAVPHLLNNEYFSNDKAQRVCRGLSTCVITII